MKIIADTHTHTNACQHAYSTLLENVRAAKAKGLRFIANTEHCPAIPGAPHIWYFTNQDAFPHTIEDVIVLRGAEVNILDYSGTMDFPAKAMSELDWVIASLHDPVLIPGTVEQHTNAWLKIAENPHVDVIGHCGDKRFAFDYERVIKAFAANGKIVEINNHSFESRPGSDINCLTIAKLCKQYGVKIVVSSDAHSCFEIGKFDDSLHILKEIDFPEQMVLNADYDRFYEVAVSKSPDGLK